MEVKACALAALRRRTIQMLIRESLALQRAVLTSTELVHLPRRQGIRRGK
jgi:hypothetical protein